MSKYLVKVNGKSIEVEVEQIDGTPVVSNIQRHVTQKAATASSAEPQAQPQAASAPTAGSGADVTALMPGNVLDILVKAGDFVKKGQVLLIFEAMKMENELAAEQDGVITAVCVEKGATINTGDVLMKFQR